MQLIPTGDAEKPRNTFPEVRVGEAVITEEAIARELQHHPAEEVANAWHNAARSLVIRELLLQKAEQLGINDDDEEVRLARVLEQELDVPEPDEAGCQRFYQANLSLFCSATIISASHILLAAAPDDVEERLRQEEAAHLLLKQLLEGRAQFGALAKQYSACESRHQGGSLGQLGKGQTVEEFERPLWHLQEGLSPEVIETRYGYHLVRVDQRIEGEQLPFEYAKPKIRQYLLESVTRRAFRQYMQVLAYEVGVAGVDLELPDSPLMQ